jgi:hypothetical protein
MRGYISPLKDNRLYIHRMSRVYRIWLNEFYYCGSTKDSLKTRLTEHKYQSKKSPTVKFYQKATELGWDKAVIELVEECGDLDNIAILQREDSYIILTDPLCLNTKRAILTDEDKRFKKNEYSKAFRLRKRKLNPLPSPLTDEEIKQHQRDASARWRDKHPDKVKELNKKEWEIKKTKVLTDEEKEAKRTYQREYMRKRRIKD